MSLNTYTTAEIETLFRRLGATGLRHKSRSLRCRCPIHQGDNSLSFSLYQDEFGTWRASCFSHGCVQGSQIEWVVRKVLGGSLDDAVVWIKQTLQRGDLVLPTGTPSVLPDTVTRDVAVADEAMVRRLQRLYPYHPYWGARGFTSDVVSEYGLTYRSLDNRAVIPFYAPGNALVGLLTRALDPDCEVKYLWESPNSHKGDFLYGVEQARRRSLTINGKRVVFVVEGTLDVIKGAECGYPLVATNTNRVSTTQVADLITNWDVVILIPDNDMPGEQLVTASKKYLASFVDVLVMPLTEVKDLDSLSTEQVGAFLSTAIQNWSKAWQGRSRSRKSFLSLS